MTGRIKRLRAGLRIGLRKTKGAGLRKGLRARLSRIKSLAGLNPLTRLTPKPGAAFLNR